MKIAALGVCALAVAAGSASADVYADATGEVFDVGFTHLDIASVEITNDASWLYIAVQAQSSLTDTDWGKYGIGINNGKDASDAGNGWGRPIDWAGQTITHWSATWADSGSGGEVYAYDGAAWNLSDATSAAGTDIAMDTSLQFAGVQQWRISLAALNLAIGDTMTFDVVTTGGGGGDPGVDHLSNSSQSTPFWDTPSTAGEFLSYTVVPSPSTIGLAGLGGLLAVRRRRSIR